MAIIEGGNVLPGYGAPYVLSGAPANGTDEVQTLTVTGTPTGGTFKLSYMGEQTAAIAYNANAAVVQAALRLIGSIGTGVTCTGGALPGTPVVVTFTGPMAKRAVSLLVLANNAMTGGTSPTMGIVRTTPGVEATYRDAPPGAMLVDTATGTRYRSAGTVAGTPIWTAADA